MTGKVKQERLGFLAKNPFYTKRFAYYVGKRCQESSISAVASELHLDWKTTKALEIEYLEEKLRRRPDSNPEVIGIDELAIGKGHRYWVTVSDLKNRLPLWFEGPGRKEENVDTFYTSLEDAKKSSIKLVLMDMWKPYEKSTKKNVPDAAIMYDRFHIMKHLNNAIDEIRKDEYRRASESDRKYIKGQKYVLLSHRENLTKDAKTGLTELLAVNKRLNTAYVLKESFSQLWSYKSPLWARKFFDNWKDSLEGQNLKSFEVFAELIDRHWDGIAVFCTYGGKVPAGFVEGFNNKIRTIIKRAYGLRDTQYLRLKILTCMLPEFT
jgi:transposase